MSPAWNFIHEYQCPFCGALPGTRCTWPEGSGYTASILHPDRVEAATDDIARGLLGQPSKAAEIKARLAIG